MAHFFRFASVNHPAEHGYLVYRSVLDAPGQKSHRPFCEWATAYDTYGDGITQHSPEWPVQAEQADDFLISLAAHLLSDRATVEDLETVEARWPYCFDAKEIRFLANVKYRPAPEGKPQKPAYFSRSEQKVSSAPAKRFDKRWEEVPSHADGSLDSVMSLRGRQYEELLDTYFVRDKARDLLQDELDRWAPPTWKALKLPDIGTAFGAVHDLVAAKRLKDGAVRALECYRHNLEWKQKRAAEKAKADADAKAQAAACAADETAAPVPAEGEGS